MDPIPRSLNALALPASGGKDEQDFPRHLMVQKANAIREAIRAIEAADDKPDLIGIR